MTFIRVRGSRLIASVEPLAEGVGFTWTLVCGHTVASPSRPRPAQKSAVCKACRRETEALTIRELNVAATKRSRWKRVAHGLCRDCGSPAAPGRKQCDRHLKLNTANSKRVRERRLARERAGAEAS